MALPARGADIFSPGELTKAHEKLEGLKNCTQCHAAGQQLSADKCLKCHQPVADSIAQARGLHGRLAEAQRRSCESCHHEHQGRLFAMIDFGEGGQKKFDHTRAGWPLHGAHAKVDCGKCHTEPGKFMGLQTSCASCHKDEHRGQLGLDCAKCHNDSAWKPAAGFSHARAAFQLRGKHAQVECAGCHKKEAEVVRFKPVAHESCTACHRDVHEGKFGKSCQECHTETWWKDIRTERSTGARAFHDKTAYALLGAHVKVACKECHGPFPDGRPKKMKGLAFEHCTDCHADAHAGQVKDDCQSCHTVKTFATCTYGVARHVGWPLEGKHATTRCEACHVKDARLRARSKVLLKLDGSACTSCHADAHAGAVQTDCRGCHSAQSFKPANYEAEDHQSWPLQGAHGAVACALCHPRDQKILAKVKQQKRPARGPWIVRASATQLKPVALPASCEACHADPHQGAFAPHGCTACHTEQGFRGARFDHAATQQACASCHAEPHAGQLGADCARCHLTERWKPEKFVHDAAFKLEGRHAGLACEKCHPRAPGLNAALYKPLPQSCEGCHADFHRGAFERFTP